MMSNNIVNIQVVLDVTAVGGAAGYGGEAALDGGMTHAWRGAPTEQMARGDRMVTSKQRARTGEGVPIEEQRGKTMVATTNLASCGKPGMMMDGRRLSFFSKQGEAHKEHWPLRAQHPLQRQHSSSTVLT